MTRFSWLALTVLMVFAWAGEALAQQAIRPGDRINGRLDRSDPRLPSGEHMDIYVLEGRPGQRLTIVMRSGELDPYLMIRGPGGYRDDNDDISPSDRSAQLDVRLPASGTYRVVATSYAPGETGRYSLEVRDGGGQASLGVVDSRGGAIRPGQTVTGSLTPGDSRLDTGEYRDNWTFSGRRGDRFTARLNSSDFDAYLIVRGPGGLAADNDDDPNERGSRNSRLSFTLPADGQFTISATSYAPGETGRYSLSLQPDGAPSQNAPGAASPSGRIQIGGTVQGRLVPGDVQLESGEYLNTYELQGRAGQQLDIRLMSSDFDPYLAINGPGGLSEFNDDDPSQPNSRNSRLLVTLPDNGVYRLYVTSYAPGESGAYRLSVSAASADAMRPQPGRQTGSPYAHERSGGRLEIGESARGRLSGGDEQLSSGEYVQYYSFIGRRGQRVLIDAVSSEFDAYLLMTTPEGEQHDNDDGPNGTNAQINMVLPEDGEYRLGVTSFRPGETGRYELSVAVGQESERQRTVQAGARVFAVMVGISDYGGYSSDLPFTDEDAEKLDEALRRQGVLNPSSVLLTNAQATRASVIAAFDRVARQAGPDDVFLFFFSGHGNQIPTSDPTELDGLSETLVMRDGEITDRELAEMFGRVNARLSMIVLDSCFSGGFARNVINRPGVMGLFSSEEDLTSAVAGKFQAGGYLSHFLRTGLTGEADGDSDGLITAGELSTYLRRQFNIDVNDIAATTRDGQRNYQTLVVDRGGVQVDDVVIRLAR